MSCNHCGTKFNIFHKELGCANCGLALCSKCLKQKSKVPSKGLGEYHVCRICYKRLSSCNETQEVFEPPDIFFRRLEKLENPAAPAITVYRENSNVTSLKVGLSAADKEIVDRLTKLKEKPTTVPSDIEIRERLAKLKGQTLGQSPQTQMHQFLPDTRSDHEKVDSLLEQLGAEQNIEDFRDCTSDLAQKLATLKGEKYTDKDQKVVYEEADTEEEIKNITKKIINQVSLDERCPLNTFKKSEEDSPHDSPALPWCVLCNGDAVFKCLDCSNDLYCRSCSNEVHKTWGETDHRIVPFKEE